MPNIKSAIRKVKRIKKQSEVNKFRKNRKALINLNLDDRKK